MDLELVLIAIIAMYSGYKVAEKVHKHYKLYKFYRQAWSISPPQVFQDREKMVKALEKTVVFNRLDKFLIKKAFDKEKKDYKSDNEGIPYRKINNYSTFN